MTREITKREKEVLELIAAGKTNEEISGYLDITLHTVKAHISSILSKLRVKNRVLAVVIGIKENIIKI